MWKFIKSSTTNDNFLMGHSKEVCFIGRSNIGKSSLINAITTQKSLARTSNTPGRTQLINFFQDGKKTIVDLPGYGFAKMPLNVKQKMLNMIQNYLETRKELAMVFVLVDSKIGPTKDDIQMIEYLIGIGREVTIILTKSDKAKQAELSKTLKTINSFEIPFITTSSHKGKNIDKVRNLINHLM